MTELRPPRSILPRILAGGALLAALTAVLVLILTGGPTYVVHAHFSDAGQLVSGDLVEVGGLPVGSINNIGVTQDGEADIAMAITDHRFVPLHAGTLAMIRAVGAAGIANRYVALTPGPSGGMPIANGGVIPLTDTRGIVDLDMLLDMFDKPTRQELVSIIDGGATGFGAPAAANDDFRLLNPALSQTSLMGAELTRDQPALSAAVASTATTFQALDSRRADLDRAVTGLAAVLQTIAGKRAALSDILERTSSVLGQLQVTFAGLRITLPVVGGMLAAARPAAGPLVALLQRVVPDTALLGPALDDVRAQLPPTRRALIGLPALARLAVPALRSAAAAIKDAMPIFAGLRPYSIDWMAGPITLIGSVQYAYYDQLGHYARETILGGQSSDAGVLSLLPPISAPVQGAPAYRTGLLARCPGGAAEPGPDRSNPWVPAPGLCDPQDDHK